nr:hypothetical protein Iba_chr02aCG12220 [Ipomoea batatas]
MPFEGVFPPLSEHKGVKFNLPVSKDEGEKISDNVFSVSRDDAFHAHGKRVLLGMAIKLDFEKGMIAFHGIFLIRFTRYWSKPTGSRFGEAQPDGFRFVSLRDCGKA